MWNCNRYIKSDKKSYIIFADIWSLIKKIDGCANNLGKSSTPKIGEPIPWAYSMSTNLAWYRTENRLTLYFGGDYMKKSCSCSREHATNKRNSEKKKILPSTKEELKLHQCATSCCNDGKTILKKSR